MGQAVTFTCKHCGFSATVSGGEDAGVVSQTQTIWCETCGELQDAVSAVLLPDGSWRPRRVRCEADATHPVRLWTQNDPCPRCGQGPLEVDESGLMTMWD